MNLNKLFITSVMVAFGISSQAQYQPNPYSAEYTKLEERLAKGWNTWYPHSMTTQAHMPDGFAISLGLMDDSVVVDRFIATPKKKTYVLPGLRSDYGKYTSLEMRHKSARFSLESAEEGGDLYFFIKVLDNKEKFKLVVKPQMLWGRPGNTISSGKEMSGSAGGKIWKLNTNGSQTSGVLKEKQPSWILELDQPEIVVYTGKQKSVAEIRQLIVRKRNAEEKRAASYGELDSTFRVMQQSIAWNTWYDNTNNRVISPVTRNWLDWGGEWILFCWDTYFCSYMCSMYNKDLAYSNAIAITKEINHYGFVPGGATSRAKGLEHSQPPVGSTMVREIYRKYHEKWLLKEVYDELLSWNRWWPKERDKNGFLCWGADSIKEYDSANKRQAMNESGLDNSPQFDGVPYNRRSHLMELADVGLLSFYIMDCESLADISIILGKNAEATELKQRAEKYKKALSKLWSEEKGIYLNKRTDNNEISYRLSPTNFYPLLVKLPSQAQAGRMVKNYLLNPKEFYGEYMIPSISRSDTAFGGEYWRGRIWGPMNLLVYLGLRNYNFPAAQKALVDKSRNLILKSWRETGMVWENFDPNNGQGGNALDCDSYYHWSTLLGFLSFIDKGLVPSPMRKISE